MQLLKRKPFSAHQCVMPVSRAKVHTLNGRRYPQIDGQTTFIQPQPYSVQGTLGGVCQPAAPAVETIVSATASNALITVSRLSAAMCRPVFGSLPPMAAFFSRLTTAISTSSPSVISAKFRFGVSRRTASALVMSLGLLLVSAPSVSATTHFGPSFRCARRVSHACTNGAQTGRGKPNECNATFGKGRAQRQQGAGAMRTFKIAP